MTRVILYDESPRDALRDILKGHDNNPDVRSWTVSDGNRSSTGWTVRFPQNRDVQRNVIEVLSISLQCANGVVCDVNSSRTVEGSPPVGGTFTLNVTLPNSTSVSTSPLHWRAGHVDVTAAIDQLFGREVAFVERFGSSTSGYTWDVTFHSVDADLVPVGVDLSGLTGTQNSTNVTATITTVMDYSEDYHVLYPIPGDMLETAEFFPQVRVSVRGILAECNVSTVAGAASAGGLGDGCIFEALPSGNASVTSASVAAVGDGRFRVTLSGGGGLTGLANSSLDAAGVSCSVESSSATMLVCMLPSGGEAGTYPLLLRVPGYGFASFANTTTAAAAAVTYPLTLTTAAIDASPNGGAAVTVRGVGFPVNSSRAVVTVGGQVVEPLAAASTTTQIVFLAPLGSPSAVVASAIAFNGVSAAFDLSYASAFIRVTSVSPVGGAGFSERTTLTLAGTGFGTDIADVAVMLTLPPPPKISGLPQEGRRYVPCSMLTVSSTSLTCTIDGGAPGAYDVILTVGEGTGASAPGADTVPAGFRLNFAVTAVTPAALGAYYGATLTITGVGFPPHGSPAPEVSLSEHISARIALRPSPCTVLTYSSTRVTCALPPRHPVPVLSGNVSVRVLSKQYTAACTPEGACGTVVVNASSSTVSNVSSSGLAVLLPGAAASVTGVGLNASAGGRLVLLTPESAKGITAPALHAAASCDLLAGNPDGTALSCMIPNTTAAGIYTLVHVHPTLGLAGGGANVTVGARVTSITPDHFGGSGALVTLAGAGFASGGRTSVAVDGVACTAPTGAADVVVSPFSVVCVAPPAPDNDQASIHVNLTVSVAGPGGYTVDACAAAGQCAVTYNRTLTPSITAVSASALPAGVNAINLTVTGINLLAPGANASHSAHTWGVTASYGGVAVSVLAAGPAATGVEGHVSVVLNVSGVPQGVHYLDYDIAGRGRARQDYRSPEPLTVTSWVRGVMPSAGSAGGGTVITVMGGGFLLPPTPTSSSPTPRPVPTVRVCGAVCAGVAVASDGASLTCTTGELSTVSNAAALGIGMARASHRARHRASRNPPLRLKTPTCFHEAYVIMSVAPERFVGCSSTRRTCRTLPTSAGRGRIDAGLDHPLKLKREKPGFEPMLSNATHPHASTPGCVGVRGRRHHFRGLRARQQRLES